MWSTPTWWRGARKIILRIFNEEARKEANPEEAAKAQDAEWMLRGLPQMYFPKELDSDNENEAIFSSEEEDESKEDDGASWMYCTQDNIVK